MFVSLSDTKVTVMFVSLLIQSPSGGAVISVMSWTFPLFRIFGIPVRMHWFLAIMIAGRILGALGEDGSWGLRWMSVTMGILFVSILWHELAHCWMAVRLGGHAEQILLWPLGGLAYVEHDGRPQDQIKVSGIGPLSSFVLGGICAGILVATGARWEWSYLNPWAEWFPWNLTLAQAFLLHAIRLNLILGIFNLCVPAYPLDGGQMLFAFLTIRHGRQRAAEIGVPIAMASAIAIGVWGFAQKDFNLILISAWVLIESFHLRFLAKMGELDSHPAFGSGGPKFDYMPDRPKKPGFFARWRARRAQKRALREARRAEQARERVDAVLDKVSREGIGSLSPAEKEILEQASRRQRGEE